MKKILFLIPLSAILLFCFPLPGFAAVYEVTVTVNSLTVPERAAMTMHDPAMEFEFGVGNTYSRINITDKNNTSAGITAFGTNAYLKNGLTTTGSFVYDSAKAPYSVYIEGNVYPQITGKTTCNADCSPNPATSGWYVGSLYTAAGGNVSCPNPPCIIIGGSLTNIAIPPEHVVGPFNGYYFLRFPAIATIN